MGCDGGTIPRRNELVRLKKKTVQKDKDAERSVKWQDCALSQETLYEPVVTCGLGHLYNKRCVIEVLLDKETKPESIDHIKSLKDTRDLKLTRNPAYKSTNSSADENYPYMCPVSGLEMNGKFRFVALWSCGCVLSERALREIKHNVCHMCQQPFSDNDVVVLNGTDEDIEKLKEKMAVRVTNRRKSKKTKSKSETVVKTETRVKIENSTTTDVPITYIDLTFSPVKVKKEKEEEPETIPLSLPTINRTNQARGQLERQRKRARPTESAQPFVPNMPLGPYGSYKKIRRDYSIAKDPEASEVFKSIFTSHKTHQDQPRAHWVTYNPFFN